MPNLVKRIIISVAFIMNCMPSIGQQWDIGDMVNNQIASLPVLSLNGQTWAHGVVVIPTGTYRQVSTIVIDSPFVTLQCEPGAILAYAGSGDAIRILPRAQVSGPAPTQPNQGPAVNNCSIYNLSNTAVSGIHAGDISNIRLSNVAINNFNGTPISAAYWFDNTISFTEGLALEDLIANNNSIAMRFTNTAAQVLTQSFGYASIRNFRAQVRTNQVGFSVETATFLYHSYIDAIIETSDNTGTAMSVTGTGKVGGNEGDDVVFLRGECVNVSGPCTGSTLLNLGPSAQFVASGLVNSLAGTMTNVIAPGAVLTWNGTTAINRPSYNFGWTADNSVQMRFAGLPSIAFFSNNLRLAGPYVMGWSMGPATTGNYLGLSPCAAGYPALCVGNGTSADASGALNAGLYMGTQFVGNSPSPSIIAGPGAGVSPSNVSLVQGSNSFSGSIAFRTGTTPAASATVATVTFASPLLQRPNVCVISPQSAPTVAAMKSLFVGQPTTDGFVLSTGPIPLNPITAFAVGYACF